MPTYCYKTDDGSVKQQLVYPIGKAPKEVKVHGGRVAKRDYAAESVGVPSTKGWPIECYGSGVNANQAGELRDHLKEKGVPTEISKDGNPIYRNARHRRRALKVRGLVDKNSFI